MDSRISVSYHEAGHILCAWLLGIPVGVSEIMNCGEGRTLPPLWYRMTSMFREVSQQTVRRDILFLLGGDCAEELIFLCDNPHKVVTFDEIFEYTLSKRFCLDLRDLKEEASRMIMRQRATIAVLARLLEKQGKLDVYQLAILRMDWLARGKSLARYDSVSS